MRKLHLTRPLVSFDLETTGLNVISDRIIEISITKHNPSGSVETKTWRVDPQCLISEGAYQKHRISYADVDGLPQFAHYSGEILDFLAGADATGFNLVVFDIPMLQNEFKRCGINWATPNVIDVRYIYHKKERRDLSAAVKFYLGREHTGAHTAEADAIATMEILYKQVEVYPDLPDTVEGLVKFCSDAKLCDLACRFAIDEEGDYIYNFGPKRGTKVKVDPSTAHWMLKKDFLADTKEWAVKILSELGL